MIKIFSKQNKELNSDLDIWIVEWKTYKSRYLDCTLGNIVPKYQQYIQYPYLPVFLFFRYLL